MTLIKKGLQKAFYAKLNATKKKFIVYITLKSC